LLSVNKFLGTETTEQEKELKEVETYQKSRTTISMPRATQTDQNSLFNHVTGGGTISNRSSTIGSDEVFKIYEMSIKTLDEYFQ
jgi:hypothetical protein